MTFTNGQTLDIALIFCSFGLGDTGKKNGTQKYLLTKYT